MEEKLLIVDKMIKESKNVPDKLKGIVAAICKGYIRNSSGRISLKGVENVCNTKFIKVDENYKQFATDNNFFGETDTQILANGDVSHKMSYVDASNKIKLIMILTHELGHVLTEHKANKVLENGYFPFVKRTATYYTNVFYENNVLMTSSINGFSLSDGFLESICCDIFNDSIFREEIKLIGYDLEDYYYKDKRLFSSRVYDEFRDCFQLFDEILGGKLFEFACMESESNEEIVSFINKNRINIIYNYIDKTLESLWELKKYENMDRDDKFEELVGDYFANKNELLMVADILAEGSNNKDKINELMGKYADMTKFAGTIPFNDKELNYFSDKVVVYGTK